jgi:hypothetical protein
MKNNNIVSLKNAKMSMMTGVLLVLFALPLMAVPVSAGSPLPILTDNAWVLFGLGILAVLIGAVVYKGIKEEYGMPVLVVGFLLMAVGIGGGLLGALTGATPDSPFDDLPPAPVGWTADWECLPGDMGASALGDGHDAVTEFPDSPFVAADAGTPDLNKVISVVTLDLQNRKFYYDIAIDDDLASTAAAFVATDTHAQDIRCQLMNPPPAVGGGTQNIPFWGRMSVSRVTGTINNGSFAPVFYCDTTAGAYLFWGKNADGGAVAASHTADHTYTSYTAANVCPGSPPTVGDWIPLGVSTGGDADGEWVAVGHVLDLGLSDYTAPPLGSSVDVLIEIGTKPGDAQWKGDLSTLTMSIRIDTRT